MIAVGLTEMIIFFVSVGICLIFALAWIVAAEARRTVFKEEIERLRNLSESLEREKFALAERVEALEDSPGIFSDEKTQELRDKVKNLETENARLRAEALEAKKSLEEVYHALSAQN